MYIKVLQLMIYLFAILINLNCSNGWSVMGLDLTEIEDVNTVFIEVMDSDSSIHYYHERVYSTQNWCYLHQRFEDVARKDG